MSIRLQSLRVSERGGTETRGAQAVTRGLLVAEIALACTLLVGATLLVRSFVNLPAADRGLDANGVIIAWIWIRSPGLYAIQHRFRSAVQSVEDHIRQLPGVQQLAWSGGRPPGRWPTLLGRLEIRCARCDGRLHMEVEIYNAGPDFFALYGIPLLRGRTFQPSDTAQDVLVGERLAKALWPDVNPVGRSFSFEKEHFDVIGVVREIHHPSLDPRIDRPEFYTAFSGIEGYGLVNIRCRETCPDVALVRQQIRAAHPELTVIRRRSRSKMSTSSSSRSRARPLRWASPLRRLRCSPRPPGSSACSRTRSAGASVSSGFAAPSARHRRRFRRSSCATALLVALTRRRDRHRRRLVTRARNRIVPVRGLASTIQARGSWYSA